jgi:excisionase family DNA binding protein
MPQLLTPAQVAELLQVTPRTINRYAVDGRLRRVKIGQRLSRYRREDVEALLDGTDANAPSDQLEASPNTAGQGRHVPE